MSERKDKKKVIGEPMTDEQVQAFLGTEPEAGVDADFHSLLRAYRSLREEDFRRFVAFFKDQGRNLAAPGPDGRTVADVMTRHGRSEGYLAALRDAGAA